MYFYPNKRAITNFNPRWSLYMLLIGIFFISLVSCQQERDFYLKRTDIVPISGYIIPETMGLSDTVQISATAEAPNGCWNNLNFVYKEISDSIFTLTAYGIFETTGTCPEGIVTKDTTFDFIPKKAGANLFYITENSYTIQVDTIFVDKRDS